MTDYKHCDDYIRDKSQPKCLRKFLLYNRLPEIWKHEHWKKSWGEPILIADVDLSKLKPNQRYDILKQAKLQKMKRDYIHIRVTMASRFGDVGVQVYDRSRNFHTRILYGYDFRLPLEFLCNFKDYEEYCKYIDRFNNPYNIGE